jgi:hypothetical protein
MALAKVSIELIVIYFYSFEVFINQIGEMAFYKPGFIIIKSKRRMLQRHPKSTRTSAQTSISHTSASKWLAVAKCHFEGSAFKKTLITRFEKHFMICCFSRKLNIMQRM